MSIKLAVPGGIVYLANGSQTDDVSWMIEGLSDAEIADLCGTPEDARAFVQAIVEARNDYNEEQLTDEDINDAAFALNEIVQSRLS